MHPDLERLINIAKESGELSERQKEIILRKAKSLGENVDEVEVLIDTVPKATSKSTSSGREKLKKCPNCGAVITDVVMKCPECGYVFSVVKANDSSQKLFEKLNNAKSLQTKKQIIESFPIPNSKEDLLEFLLLSRPYVKDVKGAFAEAYFKKYSECIGRCQTFFSDDLDFKNFIDQYDEAVRIRKAKRKTTRWLFIPLIIVAVFLVFWGYSKISSSLRQNKERKELNSAEKEFEECLEEGNIYKASGLMNKVIQGDPAKVLRMLNSSLDAEYCSVTPSKADSILHLVFDYSLNDQLERGELLDMSKKVANYHYELNDPIGAGEALTLYSNIYTNDPNMLYFYAISNLDYYLTVGSKEGVDWIVSFTEKMFKGAPSEIKESVMEDLSTRIHSTKDFAAFGYEYGQDSVLVSVDTGSSAYEKGLLVGDKLISRDSEERIKLRRERAAEGRPYSHVFEREGQRFTVKLVYTILPFEM